MMLNKKSKTLSLIFTMLASAILTGCLETEKAKETQVEGKSEPKLKTELEKKPQGESAQESFYGTLEPIASDAIYFLMTDRFVNGDPSNDFPEQGGEFPTYRNELKGAKGESAFVGYMGGDFKGIVENAGYIQEMGFGAIWLTPIVDQPDEAFAGGEVIEFGGAFKDGGKTGYHGYWGSNFYQLDEHLPSKELDFKKLTETLNNKYQLKTVLDVVLNHGSPAFSMPKQQPKFGQLFDQNNQLVADHENLEPENLDSNNPLHQFYAKEKDIMQLSDMDPNNPAVLDYFVKAYLQWIEQGADAFRIDTIKHMPHSFWKKFSDAIRKEKPDFFMFAESYSFDAEFIALHTLDENGGVSVLDFPGREAMLEVFEKPDSDFNRLTEYLYLEEGPYKNVYELMTFYDNHDMSRINATPTGFIDAHNWLFTSRGIPVIYYGSEIGFMAGKKEHEGNRNYFGEANIHSAAQNPIYQQLKRIANVRKNTPALQRGIQVNLEFDGHKAAFYRIFEHEGTMQTALVLLNKGNENANFKVEQFLSDGDWQEVVTGKERIQINQTPLETTVAAHDVKVFLLSEKNTNKALLAYLKTLKKQ